MGWVAQLLAFNSNRRPRGFLSCKLQAMHNLQLPLTKTPTNHAFCLFLKHNTRLENGYDQLCPRITGTQTKVQDLGFVHGTATDTVTTVQEAEWVPGLF